MSESQSEFRKQVRRSIKSIVRPTPEVMRGICGNGDGSSLYVSGEPRYIWVRVNGVKMTVFNNRITPLYDLPVLVGYDELNPQLLQVISFDYGAQAASFPGNLPLHGDTHRLFSPTGGNDPVFVDLRQFLPLGVTTGALTVHIYRGVIPVGNGWVSVPDTAVDLTSYLPISGHKFVLIYVDNAGDVQVADGVSTLSSLTLADVPVVPDACIAIAAVRLYVNQTALSDSATSSDIVDLRFPGRASHTPVSLDSDAGAILDLSGQQIGLDQQTANTLLAGPVTGAVDEPTFRVLVAADVGTGTPDNTKFLRDDMSWQAVAAGDNSSNSNIWLADDDVMKVNTRGKGEIESFSIVGLPDVTNPVMAVGAGAASDNKIREIGNILYEPDETTRRYKMFYTGYNAGAATDEKIHYAYSEDGKTWTKYSSNPVISTRRAEDPYVLRVANIYYLYAEDKEAGGENYIRRWHSNDCMTWVDDGQITGITNVQSPVVWMEGATWYMLYEQYPADPKDVRLATSTDGLAWTAEPTNPVFQASDTTWATLPTVPDDIIKIGGTYYMLFHSLSGGTHHEGIAKSTNLTTWTDMGAPFHSGELSDPIVTASWLNDTRLTIYYYTVDTAGIYRGFPTNPTGTISGGVLTIDGDYYIVKAQSSTADDLDTISGAQAHQFVVLQPYTGHTITVKHGTGNINLNNANDLPLSGENSIMLFFDGTNWSEISEENLALDDLTDVDTTGVGTGDILYNNAGTWEDYPLGIGINFANEDGRIKIGDLADGNYLEIDNDDGEVTLIGGATAWDDVQVTVVLRNTGATTRDPSFTKWFDNGAGSRGVYVYGFGDEAVNEKELFFTLQMTHRQDQSAAVHVHVHWIGDTTADPAVVKWGLEYNWVSPLEVFGNTDIIYATALELDAATGITAYKHNITEFVALTPDTTQDGLSSIMIGRIFRNSSDAGDTYTGGEAGLLAIDAHVLINSFGSYTEYTKTRIEFRLTESGDIRLLESGDRRLME